MQPNQLSPLSQEQLAALVQVLQQAQPQSQSQSPSNTVTRQVTNRGQVALSEAVKNVVASKDEKGGVVSKAEARNNEILNVFDQLYDSCYVEKSDTVVVKNKGVNYSYSPFSFLSAKRLLSKIFRARFPGARLPGTAVDNLYKTLVNNAPKSVKTLRNSIILVGFNTDKEGVNINTLYWDANDGEFIKELGDKACFRKLFDNGYSEADGDDGLDGEDQDQHKWALDLKLEDINQETVKEAYSAALQVLNLCDGELMPYSHIGNKKKADIELRATLDASPYASMIKRLDFTQDDSPLNTFWVWSNSNIGRANDMLKAVSAVFFKKKPTGAFLLIGSTRNGKSTMIDMVRAELGEQNVSATKITDFEDAQHHADALATTMLNAPDDDDDDISKVTKSQGIFKTITSNGSVEVRRMYSSTPIKLKANWVNMFPLNDPPKWSGGSKAALMKRSLCISFNNDLSSKDKASKTFAKDTFTPAFYSVLIGVQGAFAKYYSEHDLSFSDEMEAMISGIKEDIDGEDVFVNKALKYFKGFSKEVFEEEYRVWSKEHGAECHPKLMQNRFKMRLGWESNDNKAKPTTKYCPVDGVSHKYQPYGSTVKNKSELVLFEYETLLVLETVKIENDGTVVNEERLTTIGWLHSENHIQANVQKESRSAIDEIENYIMNSDTVHTIEDYWKRVKEAQLHDNERGGVKWLH